MIPALTATSWAFSTEAQIDLWRDLTKAWLLGQALWTKAALDVAFWPVMPL